MVFKVRAEYEDKSYAIRYFTVERREQIWYLVEDWLDKKKHLNIIKIEAIRGDIE